MSAQQRHDDFQALCLATQPQGAAAERRQRAVQRHRRVVATWLTALLMAGIVLPPAISATQARPPAATVTS